MRASGHFLQVKLGYTRPLLDSAVSPAPKRVHKWQTQQRLFTSRFSFPSSETFVPLRWDTQGTIPYFGAYPAGASMEIAFSLRTARVAVLGERQANAH